MFPEVAAPLGAPERERGGGERGRERGREKTVVQSLLSKHNVHMLPFFYSKVKDVFIELFVLSKNAF